MTGKGTEFMLRYNTVIVETNDFNDCIHHKLIRRNNTIEYEHSSLISTEFRRLAQNLTVLVQNEKY